ncbi:unnamed protein product [Penicillium roqueforti FM164]|uniref:Genomic scaffold, ProqFM164S01 n=1 Tax=Penicillium roqueforti (strain FM164) TaxID=1365484 RepID=W6PZM3_PENRF|nr:unnamed protein product [Penicillium roqueforti FM164]
MNGTFSGLVPYSDHWDVQQQCYCDVYPFFDSAAGCQECFRKHGGIEELRDGGLERYCSANPQTTGFYPFAKEWSSSSAASLPTTTAADSLGTQTAASLYYTYAEENTAAGVSSTSEKNSAVSSTRLSLGRALMAVRSLVLMLTQ